jgi:CheY-like chemotaxis protein
MDELSLLLVEDNVDDEWLALRALKKAGVTRVFVARDGLLAVSHLDTAVQLGEAYLPDLILLDLKLPKLDGIDVLRKLRLQPATAHLNVVVLSSSEDPHALATCRNLGTLACFQKPLTDESLLEMLQLLPQCPKRLTDNSP